MVLLKRSYGYMWSSVPLMVDLEGGRFIVNECLVLAGLAAHLQNIGHISHLQHKCCLLTGWQKSHASTTFCYTCTIWIYSDPYILCGANYWHCNCNNLCSQLVPQAGIAQWPCSNHREHTGIITKSGFVQNRSINDCFHRYQCMYF